ncbi:MAG: LysR family transcriptional regulator [Deltaproteobacteria bacterium]|nr:LysR family transcriptional regulator [Deltaproteobacteria bacterium]MBW2396505.1 LysR family transcriptional regulator [Deltaproteobacteria bacterium]
MIDIRHIRHLLAVASHSTLQAAADAIHLTQPALTQSIARFEEELDAKLFDRRGRRLVLTELGERLVGRGEDLLRHVRELEEEVSLWKGMGTGAVGIGVDPEAEMSLLPGVLETFVPAQRGVQVTVRSGHTAMLLPALLSGELHFLVADAEIALERDDLEIQKLAADPIAAALRPGHPLVRKRKPTAAELAVYPVAGASTAPRFERWSAERTGGEGAEPLVPALICDNYEVMVRLAERSDTVVFGPRELLMGYARTGRIKVMGWPLEGPEISPSLIRSKGRQLSPAAERLMMLFGS